jgi:hypothetical protein
MNNDEKFKITVESFRYALGHGVKVVTIYLAIVAALFKFALDTAATTKLFYTLDIVGIVFCAWMAFVIQVHYNGIKALGNSLEFLSVELDLLTHKGDGRRYCQFIIAMHIFNTCLMFIFFVILIIGPNILLTQHKLTH